MSLTLLYVPSCEVPTATKRSSLVQPPPLQTYASIPLPPSRPVQSSTTVEMLAALYA